MLQFAKFAETKQLASGCACQRGFMSGKNKTRRFDERWVDCAAAQAAYEQAKARKVEFKQLRDLGPGLLSRIRGRGKSGDVQVARLVQYANIKKFADLCDVLVETLLVGGDGMNPPESSLDNSFPEIHDARGAAAGPIATDGSLTETPIGWWTGDGTTQSMCGDRNGKMFGDVGFAQGKRGKAFIFGKNGGHIQTSATGFPDGNSDRTLALWALLTSYPKEGEEAFFAGYGAFGEYARTYHLGYSSRIGPFFSDWREGALYSRVPWSTGKWYYVAAVNNGNFCSLYIDGICVANNYMNLATKGTDFFIGAIPEDNMRRLNGKVQHVKLYDVALTSEQLMYEFRCL